MCQSQIAAAVVTLISKVDSVIHILSPVVSVLSLPLAAAFLSFV